MRGLVMHGLALTLIAVFCLLQPSTRALAQITFERTYGRVNYDVGNSVEQTSDRGYIVAGMAFTRETWSYDVYLIKTDSLGDTLWTRTYDGHWGWSVQQTSDGGYVVAGDTYSSGTGTIDFYLVKTDSLGDTLWTRTYSGTSYDQGLSVQQTSDGGYIIAGFMLSFGAGLEDVYLVRTDSLGDTLWTRTYGGSDRDVGRSVLQTLDGGYIIVGERTFAPWDSTNVYLIKVDSLGGSIWERTYGGLDNDGGFSVQQTQDHGYIVAGYTYSMGLGDPDAYLIRTNSQGIAIWERTYGGLDGDRAYSVDRTSDGGYVMVGDTWSFGAGRSDVYLVKTDSLGDTLWTRTFGGIEHDYGRTVRQTLDGGYIIVGTTRSFGNSHEVYLIKTDENGLIGILEETGRPKMEIAKLLQNQPNPFHGTTVISYSLPGSAQVTLQVFDITGRLVETLVNKAQEHGSYQVQWNSKDNPSGIYFCRLQTGDFTDTKKMTLLR